MSPHDDHLTPIPRPACTQCGVAMWLDHIERTKPYYEKRTYICPSCGAAYSIVVRFDE